MKLVVFTNDYPEISGEPFLEDELRVAESKFDRILIVSMAREARQIKYYVPRNAQVVYPRMNESKYSGIVKSAFHLFNVRTIEEIVFACKLRSLKELPHIIVQLILLDRYVNKILAFKYMWEASETKDEKQIFYSYWLSGAFLSLYPEAFPGIRIARAHGGDCFFERGYQPYIKKQLEKLHHIYSISDAGKKDLMMHYGHLVPNLDKKITISRLGVNIRKATEVQKSGKDNKRIVLTCSNMVRIKRIDLLIEALSRIDDQNVLWIHIGDGEEAELIKRQAFKKLTPKSNIDYKFYGRMNHDDILDFYRKSCIYLFINCSDNEGIPVSIMEAMSFGIPIIARNVGGIKELVSQECGILLPAEADPQALADAIDSLLKLKSDEYIRMSEFAVRFVTNCYDITTNSNSFFNSVQSLVDDDSLICHK